MNGIGEQLERLTAGFAATVAEESHGIEDAARTVTSALEGAAARLGVTLPAAATSAPPTALQVAVPPPAEPRGTAAAVLLAVPAGVSRESHGVAPPGAVLGAFPLAPEPPGASAAPLAFASPSPPPPASFLPLAAARAPLPAGATPTTGEQPFLAMVEIVAAATAGSSPGSPTRATILPAGALPAATGGPSPPAAGPATAASAAIAAEPPLPFRGPRPLGVAVPEVAPSAPASLVERIVSPAEPPPPAPAAAGGPLTVNGGVNVSVSAQTIDVDNAEATARIIAAQVADEIDRLTERDRFRRGLPTTSTA
jgi:hypothetical protein